MVRSRLSDLDIPEMPLHQLVSSMIGMYGDKTCCIDALSGVSLNYDKLKENIQKIASGLVRIGVQKGDVICFLAPNSIEHLQMFHGTLAAGAVVSAVNPSYTPFEIARQAKDAKAKYIFTLEGLAETAKKVKRDCHGIREVISTGHVSGCTPFIRLLSDDGEAFPFDMEFNVKEDIALLPYSSGTTGMPKGVMLTHYNIVSNLLQLAHPDAKDNVLDPMGPDDLRTIMAIAPFYHSYGMIGMLTLAVAGGARLIIVPKFTPKVFLTAIEKYKIRALPISPPLVVFLAKSPLVKSYDISSVKSMVSGAAPLASDIEDLVKSSMNLPFVKQGFGMTETTCASTMAPKDGFKSGSVGVIMANTEIEVRDVGTGKALGPNQRGELVIRGPQVMKGYLNRDEETRHCLRNGWLHTGDIGYYDDDENFFVVDRIKELIKVKGLQVAPAELESLLLSHPDIADSAVIGIPDERAGEVPRAYVVRRVGSNVTEHAIKDFVQGLVSRHKWLLGGVRFLDVIPKSENGKILRRILKAEALKELKSKL